MNSCCVYALPTIKEMRKCLRQCNGFKVKLKQSNGLSVDMGVSFVNFFVEIFRLKCK